MVFFLIIAGLTGSLLAFNQELDEFVLSQCIPPAQKNRDLTRLNPLILRERVLAHFPNAEIDRVSLSVDATHFYGLSIVPKTVNGEEKSELENDEVFIDPYTGRILGMRKWGDISQGLINLMPFLYRLHFSLALGTVGSYLFGFIALLWSIDCFIGAYLTFPAARKRQATVQLNTTHASWIGRWGKSWKIRLNGAYKTLFDMHRTGGLWPWALLFVLAWSSVGMNLQQVFNPVMRTFFTMAAYPEFPEKKHKHAQNLSWGQALKVGQTLMEEQANKHDFSVTKPNDLNFDRSANIYAYRVRSSRDINDKFGQTSVIFDAQDGTLRATTVPSGVTNGDTVTNWLFALHEAQVWGLPYKIALSITGVIIAMLSVTGVYIWWKKRKARNVVKVLRV